MDPETIPILQLPLFDYGESVTNVVELFPTVWIATESLTSPDAINRQRGLDELLELGAQKVSPLVAYMVASCINDPELNIRRKVTYILAELISPAAGSQSPDDVRLTVTGYLHNMRESTVLGLVEVAAADESAEQAIFHIFNTCPYVGKFLADICSEWKHPLAMRQKAIYFIGKVGYLDALGMLERMLTRLESRQAGQYTMAFAPPSIKSDDDLLPYLREAITQLSVR